MHESKPSPEIEGDSEPPAGADDADPRKRRTPRRLNELSVLWRCMHSSTQYLMYSSTHYLPMREKVMRKNLGSKRLHHT